ncbi:MAG: sensor histidine kinase, partial [Planctomycetes bacterium]|nr:sensor histidine kinase [Planctomycetota bacterium]
ATMVSELGRREEALAHAQEAVALYRKLAAERPDAFLPDLAMSLNTLANRLSALGRREEALTHAQEGVTLYRKLAAERPDAFLPDLAMSLNNFADRLSELGWREEALTNAYEAVALYRKLAAERPEPFLSYLVASLKSLANRLSELEWREDVLTNAEAAVTLRRKVTAERPRAFLSDMALSLSSLGDRLTDLSRLEDPVAARNEAIGLLRQVEVVCRELEKLESGQREREWQAREARQQAVAQRVKLEAWRSVSARSAHRIGNQLFASLGALRRLKKMEAPETREAVEDLEACVHRIGQIVQEFRTFSGNQPPHLRPTQVVDLLKDIVRRHKSTAENIELSTLVPDQLPVCLVDRDQIDQAIGELIENAVQHMPSGGRIRVTANQVHGPSGEEVRIVVEDTGPGVPVSDRERIFEPFFSRRPGGTGLGLAIVRQIVENHKGRIRETGHPGAGARFEIDLPVHLKEESQA